MHRRLAFLPCLLFTAALAAGCETGEPTLEDAPTAEMSSPIQGGYVDDFDTHVVGLVRLSNNGIGSCTGTVIAPNVVLTAQHCVAATSSGGSVQCGSTTFFAPYPANSFYVTTKTSLTQNPADYRQVMEILLPPGNGEFCGFDQAILILDESIPETEAVPAVPRVDTKLLADEMYYAVGYGETADGNQNSGTRYRRDGLLTNCVGDLCPGQISGSVTATEWLGDTGVCQGDSGGPAFDAYNRVVGVASRGAPGCAYPIYGHVEPWGAWIKEATIYGAQLGGYEPPAWALGAPTDPAYDFAIGQACTVPEDCPWGCHADGYCTRPCTDLGPCPDGYFCNDQLHCEQNPTPPSQPQNNDDDSGGDGDEQVGGCTVGGSVALGEGKDPTKPIPWGLPVMLGAAALFLARKGLTKQGLTKQGRRRRRG